MKQKKYIGHHDGWKRDKTGNLKPSLNKPACKPNDKSQRRLAQRIADFEKTKQEPGSGLSYTRPGSMKKVC
jgi:hypothetical protein